MRTIFWLFIFILLHNQSFSQVEVKAYTELSQSFHTSVFTTSCAKLGASIASDKGLITFFSLYQFVGNYERKNVSPFKMNSHLLGGGIKYRFRSLSKKI